MYFSVPPLCVPPGLAPLLLQLDGASLFPFFTYLKSIFKRMRISACNHSLTQSPACLSIRLFHSWPRDGCALCLPLLSQNPHFKPVPIPFSFFLAHLIENAIIVIVIVIIIIIIIIISSQQIVIFKSIKCSFKAIFGPNFLQI